MLQLDMQSQHACHQAERPRLQQCVLPCRTVPLPPIDMIAVVGKARQGQIVSRRAPAARSLARTRPGGSVHVHTSASASACPICTPAICAPSRTATSSATSCSASKDQRPQLSQLLPIGPDSNWADMQAVIKVGGITRTLLMVAIVPAVLQAAWASSTFPAALSASTPPARMHSLSRNVL